MPAFQPDGTPYGTPTRAVHQPGPPAAPPAPAQPSAELLAALHGNTALAAYAAAAAAAQPWGEDHPLTWAIRTGRITSASAVDWAAHLATNPQITLPILAALEPILDQLPTAAYAPAAGDPEDDELAEFDDLHPPRQRIRQQEETEDLSEFDHLHRGDVRDDDAADLAEFDELLPRNLRPGK